MSTGRMKDQKDFDLDQIVKVIDQALESDDQRIKDALRALMTITVLCTAEHPDQTLRNGPLARVFEDMRNLNQRLSSMERDLDNVKMRIAPHPAAPFTPPYNPFPGTTNPWEPAGTPSNPWTGTPSTGPWIGGGGGPKPMWGPSWSSTDIDNLPDVKKWAAGDDPSYRGSSASTALAEDFLKELQGKQ